jgi:drug/metabolite transporter (DMT)-like permease
MKLRGYILGILSAVSYGLIPIFILPIKQAHFSMDITLFYRFFFSAIMVGGYLIYSRQNSGSIKRSLILAILGICYALSEFLFLGYDFLTPGIASTVLFIYPVIVALIMFFFYKERLTKLSVFSLLLAFAGVIVLCKRKRFGDQFCRIGNCDAQFSFCALYGNRQQIES